MRKLIGGAAAIAIAASMIQAAPAIGQGNGNGKGNGKGNGGAAQSQQHGNQGGPGNNRGNGPQNGPNNGPGNGANSGPGNGNSKAPKLSSQGNRSGGNAPQNAPQMANRGNPGNGNGQGNSAVARNNGPQNAGNRPANPGNGNSNGNRGGADVAVDRNGFRIFTRTNQRDWSWTHSQDRGLINGCPPGLAKKYNGCRPPGLAKQEDGYRRYSRYSPDWWGFPRLGSGAYYYDDGFLVRLGSGGGINAYIPLLGGALSIGEPWPNYYRPVSVPTYYERYYDLGGQRNYRYADNVLYRLDPETAAITSIAALLTGADIRVGSRMPRGYDVYNVPYGYRDRYYDRPDARYRYSDGYVYQIDPETMLVVAAIELLI